MYLFILFSVPIIAIGISLLIQKQRNILELISLLSAGVELLAVTMVIREVLMRHSYTWSGFFSVDALSSLVLGVTVLLGFVATLHSIGYLREEQAKHMIGFKRVREFYVLTRLFLLCMYVAITATSPIITWVSVEATTLSTGFLVSFFNRKADIEAAWKYLIINSVGLLFGLMGTLLFVTQGAADGGLVTWHSLVVSASASNMLILKYAFVFLFLGYATKMGVVPFHTWKPDAYNKAPLPIGALLSGALLNVAFLAILHGKMIVDVAVGLLFSQTLFIFFGVLSIAVAAFMIYSQTNYKRMLAYSSIEHAGILLLGFGFGGIGIFGALLHMIYHAFAKSLLFFVSSTIAAKYSSSAIKDVRGMVSVLPYSSVLYLIGFFAIVGVPPFGIFFTELYILLAGFSQAFWISGLVLLFLVLIFAGFFRHVMAMLFGKVPEGIRKGEFSLWTLLPVTGLASILILVSIFIPVWLHTLLNESILLFMKHL